MDWNRSKRSSFSVGSFKPMHLNEHERYPTISPLQQQVVQPLQSQLPVRSAYYETHWPLSYSDWKTSNVNPQNDLILVATYREDAINKVELISGTPSLVEHANGMTSDGLDFVKVSETNVDLPITKLQWDPSINYQHERFLTSNDRLRLWEVDYNDRIIERASLINPSQHTHTSSTRPQSLPPLSSFDWNKVSPNLVITSSIDTTCTLWDLNYPNAPKTQLIAHDSEVFDVQFISGSADIFTSVGCDGSMRLFDLRSLEHSTIIYEPLSVASSASSSGYPSRSSGGGGSTRGSGNSTSYPPLLRLATSNTDPNIIATFAAKSDVINVMDLRYPGQPTCILGGHSSSINSIKWHPTESKLLSGGDDCQALIWDFNSRESSNCGTTKGRNLEYPKFAYSDTLEINNVTWNSKGDWIGVVSGKGFQGVKV